LRPSIGGIKPIDGRSERNFKLPKIDMIVLDVHGTLNEMIEGFIKWYELPDDSIAKWPRGVYDLRKAVGRGFVMDEAHPEFLGVSFWAKLAPTYEWTLFTELRPHVPIMLCSRDLDAHCATGTFIWANKWMQGVPIVFTGGKLKAEHIIPNGDKSRILLVDDSDEEINAWSGPTLLVPKVWNSAHALADAGKTGDVVADGILEALR